MDKRMKMTDDQIPAELLALAKAKGGEIKRITPAIQQHLTIARVSKLIETAEKNAHDDSQVIADLMAATVIYAKTMIKNKCNKNADEQRKEFLRFAKDVWENVAS